MVSNRMNQVGGTGGRGGSNTGSAFALIFMHMWGQTSSLTQSTGCDTREAEIEVLQMHNSRQFHIRRKKRNRSELRSRRIVWGNRGGTMQVPASLIYEPFQKKKVRNDDIGLSFILRDLQGVQLSSSCSISHRRSEVRQPPISLQTVHLFSLNGNKHT